MLSRNILVALCFMSIVIVVESSNFEQDMRVLRATRMKCFMHQERRQKEVALSMLAATVNRLETKNMGLRSSGKTNKTSLCREWAPGKHEGLFSQNVTHYGFGREAGTEVDDMPPLISY